MSYCADLEIKCFFFKFHPYLYCYNNLKLPNIIIVITS